ncbi:hypothetical protein Tco_1233377 [Tanacetum coccineum]
METIREALWICRQLDRMQNTLKETQWLQQKEQMSQIREHARTQTKNSFGLRPALPEEESNNKETMIINPERLEQFITVGVILPANYKRRLRDVLKENIDVFAWSGSKGTAVPRFVMEHQLKIYPLAEPIVYKRRPMTPDRRQAPKDKEVKVLASLIEYPYKCFLRLPKENIQIKMAEANEEKTGFHTEEGVYCFTHMPKGLKNLAATLQRMMERVLSDQRGENVEAYLEEIVIKIKNEYSLIQDVEEMLSE